MIQINVVSRINEDKNFFFDLLFAVFRLREENINDINVLFIGDILSKAVYQDMVRLANLFGITENIWFTKKSVRFNELSEDLKAGYFFNFTIGDFMGFSGIESIDNGYKTIFYNTDRGLATATIQSASMCPDISSLITLLLNIKRDQKGMDERILADNLRIKNEFILDKADKTFLRSIMMGVPAHA